MWFQHLAWNHVCMISYLHCLVFKEHCFLTDFVKSLSDFCKLSVWVSFYIIPHSVPFVKNFFEIFFIASFKAVSASVQLQGFALLYLSDNDIYITTNLHLCQHFYKIFLIFFLPLINSDLPSWWRCIRSSLKITQKKQRYFAIWQKNVIIKARGAPVNGLPRISC